MLARRIARGDIPLVTTSPTAGPRTAIAWSAFLGVSWTWCIGMFLPVLLVRDFGVAGFFVFAIPNIVGAAIMGRTLPSAQSSRQFVDRHRTACAAFSAVTILFHLFFLAWVAHGLIGPTAYLIAAGFLVIMLPTFLSQPLTLVLSWLLLAGSLVAFADVAIRAPDAMEQIHPFGTQPPLNLLGLTLVCILGFSLCPYLDLTFHRARQATSPQGGVVAFNVGFGGCFAAMIFFTLWYSHLLDPARWNQVPRPIAWAIVLHMCAQSAFTIAAHLRSLAMQWTPETRRGTMLGGLAAMSPLILWHILGADQRSSETIYRLFMGFYGLVFPAYLWICMTGVSRRSITVLAMVVIACAPMFWLGFIDEKMLWLIPGVALLLLARRFTSAGPLRVPETGVPNVPRHARTTDAR